MAHTSSNRNRGSERSQHRHAKRGERDRHEPRYDQTRDWQPAGSDYFNNGRRAEDHELEARAPSRGFRDSDLGYGQDYFFGQDAYRQNRNPIAERYQAPDHDRWSDASDTGYLDHGSLSRGTHNLMRRQRGLEEQGQLPADSFRGKGPKNFRRSDNRIYEEVCEALEDCDALDATDIEVTVEEGEIFLKGAVADRRCKRLAEEVAESVRGVRDVHNELKVQAPRDSSDLKKHTRAA